MTRVSDAQHAASLGVDAIGLIFADFSPRYVTPQQAKEISLSLGVLPARVGVFVNSPLNEVLNIASTARLTAIQLHGQESLSYAREVAQYYPVLKALHTSKLTPEWLEAEDIDILLDAAEAGSGKTFDWHMLEQFPKRWWLAGGLGSHNVDSALSFFKKNLPLGVDAVSHLEAQKGIKDPIKMQNFVAKVRQWTELNQS